MIVVKVSDDHIIVLPSDVANIKREAEGISINGVYIKNPTLGTLDEVWKHVVREFEKLAEK